MPLSSFYIPWLRLRMAMEIQKFVKQGKKEYQKMTPCSCIMEPFCRCHSKIEQEGKTEFWGKDIIWITSLLGWGIILCPVIQAIGRPDLKDFLRPSSSGEVISGWPPALNFLWKSLNVRNMTPIHGKMPISSFYIS